MAQAELRFRHRLSIASIAILALLSGLLTACLANDRPVGMSLLFQSAGHPVGVGKFNPDGQRGPVPGAVGGMFPKGGAQMSFMPGDSKRGMPKFVDVEWMVATPAYDEEWKVLSSRSDRYSEKWLADVSVVNANAPHYTKRIDLTSIITPELVAQVRADQRGSLLKLIITFNNDQVDIKAEVEKWR